MEPRPRVASMESSDPDPDLRPHVKRETGSFDVRVDQADRRATRHARRATHGPREHGIFRAIALQSSCHGSAVASDSSFENFMF